MLRSAYTKSLVCTGYRHPSSNRQTPDLNWLPVAGGTDNDGVEGPVQTENPKTELYAAVAMTTRHD